MSVQLARLADASMTVAVSRAAPGDLAAGVETKLARLDGVRAVESLELCGLQPGLNDLTVEVETTLALDADLPDEPAALAADFEDAFGVSAVTVDATRGVPPDAAEAADGTAADAA
ncbi:hypothetical protein [Halorarum halobium]|uniref:hypothetical protein n=1 Tax=Halorarum halobium TaxID=3075121 RepID=UPI0028ADCD90|nr:hypothetical protein [Halobaculum sp. XH14]